MHHRSSCWRCWYCGAQSAGPLPACLATRAIARRGLARIVDFMQPSGRTRQLRLSRFTREVCRPANIRITALQPPHKHTSNNCVHASHFWSAGHQGIGLGDVLRVMIWGLRFSAATNRRVYQRPALPSICKHAATEEQQSHSRTRLTPECSIFLPRTTRSRCGRSLCPRGPSTGSRIRLRSSRGTRSSPESSRL